MLNAVRNPEFIADLGLASSAFARHYSQNLVWFLFLPLLRCFSSGGSPHIPIWFSIWYMILHHMCSHIRKSAYRSLFAAPRSLSQLVTSFVGSQCQGILHMLFLAWTTFVYWSQYTRFSSMLELLCIILAVFWQNCFFLPFFTEKPDFVFHV